MTQRDVLERVERIAKYQWLDLGPMGRRLVLRCIRALEADVAVEERNRRTAEPRNPR